MVSNHVSDARSIISECTTILSSQRRIMTVRTLNESLVARTEEQLEAARVRRRLRLPGVSFDHELDLSSHSTNRILTVTFNTIKVREYPIILGDNPGVSEGPPLTIDWMYIDVDEFDVEEYENTRPTRRRMLEMAIPACIRRDTLKRSGCSSQDIHERLKEVKLTKQGRLETTSMLYRSETSEKIEKAKRRVSNFFSTKKKKERALIAASMESMKIQQAAADTQAQMEDEALAELLTVSLDARDESPTDDVGQN